MDQAEFRFYKLSFLLPGLLALLAIILFPLLFTIRVSLSGWDAISPGLNWAGVKNYVAVFNDRRFWGDAAPGRHGRRHGANPVCAGLCPCVAGVA